MEIKRGEKKPNGLIGRIFQVFESLVNFFRRTENRVYIFRFEGISATATLSENSVEMRRDGEVTGVQVGAIDASGAINLIDWSFRIYNLNVDVPFSIPGRLNAGGTDFVPAHLWRTDESHAAHSGQGLFPGWKYRARQEIRVSCQAEPSISTRVLKCFVVLFVREAL